MMKLAESIELPGEAHSHLMRLLHAARGIVLAQETHFACGRMMDKDMEATSTILGDLLTEALHLAELDRAAVQGAIRP